MKRFSCISFLSGIPCHGYTVFAHTSLQLYFVCKRRRTFKTKELLGGGGKGKKAKKERGLFLYASDRSTFTVLLDLYCTSNSETEISAFSSPEGDTRRRKGTWEVILLKQKGGKGKQAILWATG
jgi:hypothetical protein